MNRYFKEFLHRGLMFGGFGPIVMGIVYAVLSQTISDFSLTGNQMLLAVVSTYIIAFIQAGASVFNQIEHWSLPKSMLFHFLLLYVTYSVCYVVNSWIPFEPIVLIIFSLIFVVIYLVVWITVYFSLKLTSKKMNEKLK